MRTPGSTGELVVVMVGPPTDVSSIQQVRWGGRRVPAGAGVLRSADAADGRAETPPTGGQNRADGGEYAMSEVMNAAGDGRKNRKDTQGS